MMSLFICSSYTYYAFNSAGPQQGEAETAVAGTVRLQSDGLVRFPHP